MGTFNGNVARASGNTASFNAHSIAGPSNLNMQLVLAEKKPAKLAAKRTVARSKTIHVDRGVHLHQIPQVAASHVVIRRSTRIAVPAAPYNYGMVRCTVCKKSYRQDLPIELYGGPIVCSFACMKK